MASSYETRVLELTEAGAPSRVAQTRAAAEFLRERRMTLAQAIENGVLTIDEKLREDIDEEFLQRLLKKMGLEAQIRRGSTKVQSILFPVARFDVPKARKWAKSHDFPVSKVTTEGKFVHVRVRDPSSCKAIRTINFGGGIKARVCVGQ